MLQVKIIFTSKFLSSGVFLFPLSPSPNKILFNHELGLGDKEN